MNKSQSKYFNTANLMDEALLYLLEKKDFEHITIKEICKKAGVNRSTFYLHYDNTNDLLVEASEFLNKKFIDKYREFGIEKLNVETLEKKEANFITPKYLFPYLEFIKENKKFFKTIYNNPKTFEAEKIFNKMYAEFFEPALKKFNIGKNKEQYIFEFYMKGVLAIIIKWFNSGCNDDIDFVVNLIIECVKAPLFKE